MNFQVTVLKILVSYPDGFAVMEDLKRDMAILATSGRDWTERTRRLAGRVPGLDIFSQGLIDRTNGGWRITDKGRAVLDLMEARPADATPASRLGPPSEERASLPKLEQTPCDGRRSCKVPTPRCRRPVCRERRTISGSWTTRRSAPRV
ncbi:hypothetical protein [Bradyrhizobium sp. i1.15.2]|uniref:hypothetical protein n=1 Tax=Bradyrhizobium sp. i1.15.2 TaxID=3156362 RepID=UPI00339978AE